MPFAVMTKRAHRWDTSLDAIDRPRLHGHIVAWWLVEAIHGVVQNLGENPMCTIEVGAVEDSRQFACPTSVLYTWDMFCEVELTNLVIGLLTRGRCETVVDSRYHFNQESVGSELCLVLDAKCDVH